MPLAVRDVIAADEVRTADEDGRDEREERGHASGSGGGAHGGRRRSMNARQSRLALVARPPLGDPPGRLGPVGTLEHEPLGVPRRSRACRAELAEDRLQCGLEIEDDLVHEPDPESRRGIEPLAGDEVAAGCALADLAEHVGRDHGRCDSELDLRESEHSPLVGERDVGRGHEPGSAAERMALNDGDHRGGAAVDRVEHAAQRIGVGNVLVVAE